MTIEFKTLILQDCFAFQHQEFTFQNGIHSLQGINGSSKTSIYLAISQALFNKNPKNTRIDEVSNVVTGQPYQITLEFTKNADLYKIVNSRKNGTISIELNGKSISRKTIPQNLELIREIVGDSYETFVNQTYQSSESTLDLVEETTDTARKNFINKLLRFDELDSLLNLNKEKQKLLKGSLKSKQEQISSLKAGYLSYKEPVLPSDIRILEEQSKSSKNKCEELSAKILELTTRKIQEQRRVEEYAEYRKKERRISEITADLAKINRPSESPKEVTAELTFCTKLKTEYALTLKQYKDKLASLKEPEVVCSRCGHELEAEDALKLYRKEVDEATFKIEEYTMLKKEVEARIWYAEESQCIWSCIESYQKELASIKLPEEGIDVADEETYKAICQELEESQRELTLTQSLAQTLSTKLTESRMIKKFNDEAEDHNAKIEQKIESLDQEVRDLEKRLELVDTWVRVLGSNGYRVHRINKFLQVLNQLMLKYSSIISKGKIKCAFYVTSEGKVEFNVVDADKSIPFSGWSAGEKSRVKLACLFAILEILEIMGSSSYNILFLDEVFATLDEGGREGLFEVLAQKKNAGKCIYTVSHTPIANAVVFDSTISVVKENGISKVV